MLFLCGKDIRSIYWNPTYFRSALKGKQVDLLHVKYANTIDIICYEKKQEKWGKIEEKKELKNDFHLSEFI